MLSSRGRVRCEKVRVFCCRCCIAYNLRFEEVAQIIDPDSKHLEWKFPRCGKQDHGRRTRVWNMKSHYFFWTSREPFLKKSNWTHLELKSSWVDMGNWFHTSHGGILECDMRAANCQWLWLVTLIDFLVIHMSISPNAFGCSVSEGFMDIDQVQHIIYYMYMCVVRHDQQLSSVTLSMNLSMGLLVHHSSAAIWCFVR